MTTHVKRENRIKMRKAVTFIEEGSGNVKRECIIIMRVNLKITSNM
jgi:hypothetical protein